MEGATHFIDLFGKEKSGALFSDDRKYRYRLWRIWDESKPLVMFIGLNPSTAKEVKNDPTINYVRKFSESWGYGGFYMMNLFGLVSSKPDALVKSGNPIGENDNHLQDVSELCKDVVFAWGKFNQTINRRQQIIDKFPNALCIGLRDGIPIHPLWAGMWAPKKLKEQFFKQPQSFHPKPLAQ